MQGFHTNPTQKVELIFCSNMKCLNPCNTLAAATGLSFSIGTVSSGFGVASDGNDRAACCRHLQIAMALTPQSEGPEYISVCTGAEKCWKLTDGTRRNPACIRGCLRYHPANDLGSLSDCQDVLKAPSIGSSWFDESYRSWFNL